MTIDDQDIERALTALADDGYPTSTNIDPAYDEFVARTSRAGQRRRTTRWAVAAGIAAILGIGGFLAFRQGVEGDGRDRLQPATPTASTTQLISSEDLVGTWSVDADWLYSGFPWLWTFNADGSASGSPNANTAENAWGYTLTGNRIDARDRPAGCTYAWQVSRFDEGVLAFEVLNHCGNQGPGITLTRLSPASPAGSAIAMPPMTDAAPLRDVADVGGVWLMQGTGMLLAIEARDPARVTYRLDDQGALAGDPIDQGTVSLDARGTLALVSANPPADGCSDPRGPGIHFTEVVVTEAPGSRPSREWSRSASTRTSRPRGSGSRRAELHPSRIAGQW